MRFIALIFGALFAHQTLASDCQTDVEVHVPITKTQTQVPGCEKTVTGPAIIHNQDVRPAIITTEVKTQDAQHPSTRLSCVPTTVVTPPIRVNDDSKENGRGNGKKNMRENRGGNGNSRENGRGNEKSRENGRGNEKSRENGKRRCGTGSGQSTNAPRNHDHTSHHSHSTGFNGKHRRRPRKVIKIDQNGCTGTIQTAHQTPTSGC